MGNYLRQHPGSFALSVLLHGVLVAALVVSIDFGTHSLPPAPPSAIQATVVDEKTVQKALDQLDEQKQAVVRQQQEKERAAQKRKAEQVEQLRVQREKAQRAEQQKREQAAAEKKKQEEAAEQARKAEEKHKREAAQQRLAEEKRKRAEEAEKRRKAAAARRQRELDAQLDADLATEEKRRKAEQSGLLDQYVRLIQNRIEQQWIKPPSAQPGLECVVDVEQIPSGTVVNVHVRPSQCNGDAAVRRSIETAVLKASPLPKPPVPELFERNLVITFRPDQVG